MVEQDKAFACSVGIHLILLLLVFGVMRATPPERKTLSIDFCLEAQPQGKQSTRAFVRTERSSGTVAVRRPVPLKIAEQIAEQRVSPASDVVVQPAPEVHVMSEKESQGTAVTPALRQSSSPYSGGAPRYEDDHGSAASPSPSGRGGVTESPEMRYVKAHFTAIRNAIIGRLSYPRQARRMGWAGTVKVSFVVNEDGGVSNVTVLASSGFDVLDKNAADIISRGSPYPKPPCKAQIVMPITYRLDE